MASMSLNAAAGLPGMLKAGHTHQGGGGAGSGGAESVLLRNVEAARDLTRIVSTSLGPDGRNKLVVNHLGRIIVTSDCAAIVRELEIEHPAARMIAMASDAQDKECGDGTNLVVSLAGELLGRTEELVRMGLHPSDIVAGYELAGTKMLELLDGIECGRLGPDEVATEAGMISVVRPVVAAKQRGSEDVLAPLVAEACLAAMGGSRRGGSGGGRPSVSPEAVRVVKILGSDVSRSRVVRGFVALRGSESAVSAVTGARVAVFGCGIEASGTEAKGTVMMKTADDLLGYNRSEEDKMEEIIKSLADAGVSVVVSGGSVSEMALHFLDRYGIMAVRCPSKFDLRRLCAATGATALVRLGPPTPEEMGSASSVRVEEVGSRKVTIFAQSAASDGGSDDDGSSRVSSLSTIVLRASTASNLQDLERAVDDGVRAAQAACRDGRVVAGAGSAEMALSVALRSYADARPGLDQYSIRAFASALEVVPRTLARNSGSDPEEAVAALGAVHASFASASAGGDGPPCLAGIDIDAAARDHGTTSGIDASTEVRDLLATKANAFRLAVDAALTVLKVDQIIMARPSGAGKMKDARMGQS